MSMEQEGTNLTREPRIVDRLVLERHEYQVGQQSVTAIEAFDEPGQNAHVAWFNIWCGTTLFCKVNAAYCCAVEYQPSPKE